MILQASGASGLCAASLLGAVGLLVGAIHAEPLPAQDVAPAVVIDDAGTVHTPEQAVPLSSFLSEEGKAYLRDHLRPARTPGARSLAAEQNRVPEYMVAYLARMKDLYPVEREERSIGGVPVYIYTPRGGVAPANAERVLINLHGGGFATCFPGCAELESIPVSSLGGFKVVSVDYRQGPEHRFPAASEDVAAVYRELLKTYEPHNIGIYGCSAGGLLTGMALAWFGPHDLPRPGAAGIFCSGLSARDIVHGGDALYVAYPLGEGRMPPAPPPGARMFPATSYLADVDPDDPLVSPRASSEVLANFPDTLVITGTRGMEFSAAVFAHGQLVKAGVDARLHVWEGLFHGFFYNPDVPESRDAYAVITKFFREHLGAPAGAADPSNKAP
jgi:monoterpene epsilon-lactone hydrolase